VQAPTRRRTNLALPLPPLQLVAANEGSKEMRKTLLRPQLLGDQLALVEATKALVGTIQFALQSGCLSRTSPRTMSCVVR
jgi:hypothetical protein